MLTEGWDGRVENDRLGLGDGLERNDGAGGLGLTEVLCLLGLMAGLDRFIDGLDRPKDGLGRLGVLTGGLGRLKDGLRDGLGRLGFMDGLGLGVELNDREPADPLRFIIEGLEGVCGGVGTALLMLDREFAPAELLRLRIWPCACGPVSRAIPAMTTTTTALPQP